MESLRVEKLYTILDSLKDHLGGTVTTKLELDKTKRIIQRLSDFSIDCDECSLSFNELEEHITQLQDKKDLTDDEIKLHTKMLADTSLHLQKKHKLVSSGYYLSMYIPIGVSLGVVFGLLIFDNIGIGLPLGAGIGVALGVVFDEDAKKKGLAL